MDQNEIAVIVGGIVAGIAIASVLLRFYSRYFQKAGFKMDDWLILIALLATIAIDIIAVYTSSAHPEGSEAASMESEVYSPEDIRYTKLVFIISVLYFAITATTKLSILFMYNRLFSVSAAFRVQNIILAVIVVSFWIGCTLGDLLACIPLEYAWINSLADPRYCINYNIFWFSSGICEAFIDVLIILMPIRVVFLLQLSRAKKIGVTAVFLFGVLAIVSGLTKAILGYVPGSREPSITRTQVWTTVHVGTGIVCACLPVCWPAFVRFGKLCQRLIPSFSIRKYFSNSSGGSSIERRGLQRNTTPDTARRTNTNTEAYVLPMYNLGTRGLTEPHEGGSEEQRTHYQHPIL